MSLRELVTAWQEQGVRCRAAFDAALTGINRELDAVGGYATTSPDQDGYCQDYDRDEKSFGGGVSRAGRKYGGTGPRRDIVAPHHPEVGDRCLALENAWRKEAYAETAAVRAVRDYVAAASGVTLSEGDHAKLDRMSVAPEHVALALLRDSHGL